MLSFVKSMARTTGNPLQAFPSSKSSASAIAMWATSATVRGMPFGTLFLIEFDVQPQALPWEDKPMWINERQDPFSCAAFPGPHDPHDPHDPHIRSPASMIPAQSRVYHFQSPRCPASSRTRTAPPSSSRPW